MTKHITAALALTLLATVASTATCHAQYVTAQFCTKAAAKAAMNENFYANYGMEILSNGTGRLHSPQQSALHFSTNDWKIAQNGALDNIAGRNATGLWLEPGAEGTNKTLRAGVLVVNAREATSRGTLVSSEFVCRLASRLHGGNQGVFDTMYAAKGVRVFVNGLEDSPIKTNELCIISFVLPAEVGIATGLAVSSAPGGADSRVMLMADPVPLWNRALDGQLLAAVLLSGDEPGESVLRGIEHGLALWHGVKGMQSATKVERDAAWATGFHGFGVWGTRFLLF